MDLEFLHHFYAAASITNLFPHSLHTNTALPSLLCMVIIIANIQHKLRPRFQKLRTIPAAAISTLLCCVQIVLVFILPELCDKKVVTAAFQKESR